MSHVVPHVLNILDYYKWDWKNSVLLEDQKQSDNPYAKW